MQILHQLAGGLRAAMGYTGSRDDRGDAHPARRSCASPTRACAKATCTTSRSPKKRPTTVSAEWPIGTASLPATASAHPPDIHADRILILDFGAQYTQLIARRVREIGVYCEIHPWDMIRRRGSRLRRRGHHSLRRPGIDDGRAAAARAASGVRAGRAGARHLLRHADDGAAARRRVDAGDASRVRLRAGRRRPRRAACSTACAITATAQGRPLLDVWMSHGDHVDAAAAGIRRRRLHRQRAARRDGRRGAPLLRRAVPSGSHAHAAGREAPERFVREICGCEARWERRQHHRRLRSRACATQVGRDKVLLGLSGGVDSSVVAALLHRAIGDQLDLRVRRHGLLRLNEGDQVMETFAKHMGVRVIRVDAEARFLDALAGRGRSGSASARSSAGCSSRCSKRRPRKLHRRPLARAGHDLSGRDRVRRRARPARRTSSSATTTSAACPRT